MNDYLAIIKPMFMHRMRLISWEASKWMQYTGYEWNQERDLLIFKFKTSSFGIGFSLSTKAFSSLYGEPYINYNEAYQYFKSIKYGELEKELINK